MTATRRGGMLLVTREAEDSYAARFLCQVGFIDSLTSAGRAVQSLRRDHHAQGKTCWLHSEGWCLSRRPPAVARSCDAINSGGL